MSSDQVVDNIAADCGRTEEEHGFREDWELATKLDVLSYAIADGTIDEKPSRERNAATLRAAAKALRDNYIGTKLMLVVSEVAEALDVLRDEGAEGILDGLGDFGEELADTHIRLWALEDMLGIHSGRQVTSKMTKNRDRPHKHGRKL